MLLHLWPCLGHLVVFTQLELAPPSPHSSRKKNARASRFWWGGLVQRDGSCPAGPWNVESLDGVGKLETAPVQEMSVQTDSDIHSRAQWERQIWSEPLEPPDVWVAVLVRWGQRTVDRSQFEPRHGLARGRVAATGQTGQHTPKKKKKKNSSSD